MEVMRETVSRSEPSRATEFREPSDPWSVPVLRWGDRSITISYSVFLLVAVVLGIALNEVAEGPGREVITATAVGLALWISGWLVQSVAYALTARLVGTPISRLAIGPFGVKTFPRKWSPSGALAVSLGTIASLVALGSLYRLIEGGFQVPALGNEPQSFWTMPSIGLTENDSPWIAGAWLCWIQAILQMLPLGSTLGRQLLAAIIAICSKRASVAVRIRIFRTALTLIAITLIPIAIRIYDNRSFPGWIIVPALAITIWVSTRSRDIVEVFLGFQHQLDEIGQTGIRDTAKQLIRTQQGRRRSKKALAREREEAVDASHLDEVLNRLKLHGADSLSKADRELLQRVSERVRKERDADSSAG